MRRHLAIAFVPLAIVVRPVSELCGEYAMIDVQPVNHRNVDRVGVQAARLGSRAFHEKPVR